MSFGPWIFDEHPGITPRARYSLQRLNEPREDQVALAADLTDEDIASAPEIIRPALATMRAMAADG